MPGSHQRFESFQVFIRVRPLSAKENEEVILYEQLRKKQKQSVKLSPTAYAFYTRYHNFNPSEIVRTDQHTVYVADPQYKNTDKKMKTYQFTRVFASDEDNRVIFQQSLREQIEMILSGYNATILTYGITGSGKTYTVFGHPKGEPGISILAYDHLFQTCELIRGEKGKTEKEIQFKFKFSFIQIYNQNARDLLSNDCRFINIVQDAQGNTATTDLTEISVNCTQDINSLIAAATTRRIFASTAANQHSSRSHAILQLAVDIIKGNQRLQSKLFIIDLAGSEKVQSINSSKKTMEGININRSLLALGHCINALVENSNSKRPIPMHIPYRDSKLTRLLKESLGGNTKTIMLACISSHPFTIEDTLTTLNYAVRAQGIKKILYQNICQKLGPDLEIGSRNQDAEHLAKIFEDIYEDMVDNFEEAHKLRAMAQTDESIRLIQVNSFQRQKLKEILKSLVLRDCLVKPALSVECPLKSGKENKDHQLEGSLDSKRRGGRYRAQSFDAEFKQNIFHLPSKSVEGRQSLRNPLSPIQSNTIQKAKLQCKLQPIRKIQTDATH